MSLAGSHAAPSDEEAKLGSSHEQNDSDNAAADDDAGRGRWSEHEDSLVRSLVAQHGASSWSTIAQSVIGRSGKQCRERWYNHLDPSISKGSWSEEEDFAIIRAHATFGNSWSRIANLLPGRPSNAIKNHWNSKLRRVSLGTLTGTQPAAIAHYAALREAYVHATAAVQEARANGSAVDGDSKAKRKSFGGARRDAKLPSLTSSPLRESALNGASSANDASTPSSSGKSALNALRTKRRRPESESVTIAAAVTAGDAATDTAAPPPPPPPPKARKRGRPSTLALAQRELERQAAATAAAEAGAPAPPPLQATPVASGLVATIVAMRRPPQARARRLAPPPADDVFVDTTVPHDDDESLDEFDDDPDDDNVLGDGSQLILSQNLFEFGGSVQPSATALASAAAVGHRADDLSNDDDDDDDDDGDNNINTVVHDDDADDAGRRRHRAAFRGASSGGAVIEGFMMSPWRRHPLMRSPHKPSPAPGSAVAAASAAATAAVNGGMSGELEDIELLFNTGPSLSDMRSHSVHARMRALTPISSPSLLSPSAVKLSVPHSRGVSKHVVRRLLSPKKRDTPLARALATETEVTTGGGGATPRRLHSMPSTPRRVTVVSNAPPSAPSPHRSTMLANNRAYKTRLSVASGGSSLAERFGVDLSPMSPTRTSPRRPLSARTRELHVRTPTAGGSFVIGGSLGQEVLVRPRNLSASFHAPQNLFSGTATVQD